MCEEITNTFHNTLFQSRSVDNDSSYVLNISIPHILSKYFQVRLNNLTLENAKLLRVVKVTSLSYSLYDFPSKIKNSIIQAVFYTVRQVSRSIQIFLITAVSNSCFS